MQNKHSLEYNPQATCFVSIFGQYILYESLQFLRKCPKLGNIFVIRKIFIATEWIQLSNIPCEHRLWQQGNKILYSRRETNLISHVKQKQFPSPTKHAHSWLQTYNGHGFFLIEVQTQLMK